MAQRFKKINPKTRKYLYQFFRYTCPFCHTRKTERLDNIVKQQKGNKLLSRMIPCCVECNQKKVSWSLQEEDFQRIEQLAEEALAYAIERHGKLQTYIKSRHRKKHLKEAGLEHLI